MRIAVLGDLHANLPALEAVLDDALALGCETVWCVGDVVGRGPHPGAVIDELRRMDLPTVSGNWDDAVGMSREQPGVAWPSHEAEAAGLASLEWTVAQLSEDQRAWLRQLPTTRRLEVEERSVLLFHGSPLRQTDYLWQDRPSRVFARLSSDQGDDLLCFGNTHEAFHMPLGKSHFVAVGAVGCGTPEALSATYAVIDMTASEMVVNFRTLPYDYLGVEADLRAAGLPSSLLRTPPSAHVAPEVDEVSEVSEEDLVEA